MMYCLYTGTGAIIECMPAQVADPATARIVCMTRTPVSLSMIPGKR